MVSMLDIFGSSCREDLASRVSDGLVTVRPHKEFPELVIANYTPKAAYEGAWDKFTLACRGLIYNRGTGEVLARPLTKFFNYGQAGAPEIALDAAVTVANKYDGSLGILYLRPDNVVAVATRGSFHSTQAEHATDVLQECDADLDWFRGGIDDGWTPLVEIIYPENRIVLDYGQEDYLQYLGSVRDSSGAFFPDRFELLTFREVIERAPRPNAEGYVVWLDRYTAIKIKQADYVALHAVVTNLSEKAVWQVTRTDSTHEWVKFVAALPDELQDWADNVRDELMSKVWTEEARLYREYEHIVDMAWDEPGNRDDMIPRKDFAVAVQKWAAPLDRSFMFSILDGRNIIDKLFDRYKPVGLGARPTGSIAAEEG